MTRNDKTVVPKNVYDMMKRKWDTYNIRHKTFHTAAEYKGKIIHVPITVAYTLSEDRLSTTIGITFCSPSDYKSMNRQYAKVRSAGRLMKSIERNDRGLPWARCTATQYLTEGMNLSEALRYGILAVAKWMKIRWMEGKTIDQLV